MAQKREKVRLKEDDWKSLFPGEEYTLGTTRIFIRPLSIEGIATVLSNVKNIAAKVLELQITAGELKLAQSVGTATSLSDAFPTKVLDLVLLIINEAPEILSELSGLDSEDVRSLPPNAALGLFNKCIEVNITSQEGLVKNFSSLGEKLTQFTTAGM